MATKRNKTSEYSRYFYHGFDTRKNIWLTGPPLSKSTDEVDIGYGEYSYNLKAFDTNTFDVEYSLTKGEVDTFIIVCTMSDFKTNVSAVDKGFGDIVDNGWDVNFVNIAEGMSIVYGHGTKKIKPSGLSTLARIYLNNPLIQQNPDTDPDTGVSTFPVFLSLGEKNYKLLDEQLTQISQEPQKRLLDSNSALWKIVSSHRLWTGKSITNDYLDASGIVTELKFLSWAADPRLSPQALNLSNNIERVLKEYQNDESFKELVDNAIAVGHYYRILSISFVIFPSS